MAEETQRDFGSGMELSNFRSALTTMEKGSRFAVYRQTARITIQRVMNKRYPALSVTGGTSDETAQKASFPCVPLLRTTGGALVQLSVSSSVFPVDVGLHGSSGLPVKLRAMANCAVSLATLCFSFLLTRMCDFSLGSELSLVTCGSVVKLLNVKHNVRLHSHDVRYGSGSGQQSVTGVTTVEDSNSYWSVRGTIGAACHRGTPVKCGQNIRLTHVNTGRNLHSHYFTSPLSSNQEVSAFGEEGEGDHLDEWTLLCGGSLWQRDESVRFRHTATDALLSVTGEQYGRPIHGQREVHAMTSSSQHSYWKAMEGIFMKPSEMGPRDFSSPTHTEF